MGRELKRVALDFDWPINKVWAGFINDRFVATTCAVCDGTGYSPEAKLLKDRWYGYVPFKPEDRGSVPFTPEDAPVRSFAERNVTSSPDYYGSGERAIMLEAHRLCRRWNGQWSHHLNAYDVAALIDAGRLYDFTHTWSRDGGWKPKEPAYMPTPREVNLWSLEGFGHDSINQWAVMHAECNRLGHSSICAACEGEGCLWPSQEAKAFYEAWESTEPPIGEGYQIWETVSEGSPISPVFATPEALAEYMAGRSWGADKGTPYETWLAFIQGPGWAPSMVMTGDKMLSGVEAVV